jgi:hypothetical protein
MAMTTKFTKPLMYNSLTRRGSNVLCSTVLRSIAASSIATLLLCCAFFWCSDAKGAERKITVVTVRNVPQQERDYYLDALRQFAFEAVTQFLGGLHLTKAQIDNEMEAVDVQSLAGKCLDQNNLLGIFKALRGVCTIATNNEFAFISTIILPKFDADYKKVMTDFFPYGLNRLDADVTRYSVLEYVDNYPELDNREIFDTLIVLGFLNSYWNQVKDKPKLSEAELSILYSGFGQYGDRLRSLCPSFTRAQQARCQTIAREASDLALKAKEKQ